MLCKNEAISLFVNVNARVYEQQEVIHYCIPSQAILYCRYHPHAALPLLINAEHDDDIHDDILFALSGDHLQKMERELPSSPANMKGQCFCRLWSGRALD